MSNPHEGLYVPRKLFVDMKEFSSDCICLVLANTKYNIDKSIRSVDKYLKFIKYES